MQGVWRSILLEPSGVGRWPKLSRLQIYVWKSPEKFPYHVACLNSIDLIKNYRVQKSQCLLVRGSVMGLVSLPPELHALKIINEFSLKPLQHGHHLNQVLSLLKSTESPIDNINTCQKASDPQLILCVQIEVQKKTERFYIITISTLWLWHTQNEQLSLYRSLSKDLL